MLLSNGLLRLLSCCQTITVVLAAVPKQFDRVIAFGDSLADAGGGAFVLTGGIWPSETRYFQHRFTDGQTYVERLASSLGVPLTTYAIAGATTNNADVQGYTGRLSNVPVPSLLDQVDSFIKSNTLSQYNAGRTLWILSGGSANVYASAPAEKNAVPVIGDLLRAVRELRAIGLSIPSSLSSSSHELTAGGIKFLIPNVPMRGIRSPGSTFVETEASDRLLRYATSFRDALPEMIKFESSLLILDLYQYIVDFQLRSPVFGLDPKKFGVSCLQGIYHPIPGSAPGAVTACNSSATYIWFDDYNPTGRIHSYIAANAQRAMIARGWSA